jgi:endonuclease YncB( thermonuclease family)
MRLALALLASAALAGCDRSAAQPTEGAHHRLRAGASFTCNPVRVWDGDTFGCEGGPTVRVSGIAAREVRWDGKAMQDAGCSDGHPCPSVGAVASQRALAGLLSATGAGPLPSSPTGHLLISGPELQCTSTGSAGRKRVSAFCRSPRVGDLSCAMIRGGYALKWPRYWREHRC